MITAGDVLELESVQYRVTKELGRGGTGVVHEIRRVDDDLAEPLAIKVLHPDIDITERERERFLGEAERMRRVAHAGLVSVLGAGALANGCPYLLMPRLRGESLAARLERGRMPPDEGVRVFTKLAGAVHAVHMAGMIHRDIKPENVFLVDGNPVLLDFGIARDMHSERSTTTEEGRIRGTPAYMAPERFFGEPASVASDVYELGVLLYIVLVGRLPWSSGSDVRQRLNPANPSLSGVSPGLTAAMLEALSTRPEARFADAATFAEHVEAAWFNVDESDASSRVTADMRLSLAMQPTVAVMTHAEPARRGKPWMALAAVVIAAPALAAMTLKREDAGAPVVTPAEAATPDAGVARSEPGVASGQAGSAAPSPPRKSSAPARSTVRPPQVSARPPQASERPRGDETYFEDRR
ncbi:protein kinase [Pendulispora brunnea]|uniref:Protein kinase n=1 Tax=Pendulispora brunnea TaxID=2905690 RepID=A0ABZ2K2X2_9BACT